MEKPTDIQIIEGGERVSVLYNNAAAEAFVRQVRPSELRDYLKAESLSETEILKLVASIDSQPVDPDLLALDSFDLLIEADARQNFMHARKQEDRDRNRAARMLEDLKKSHPAVYERIMRETAEGVGSALSSAKLSLGGSGLGASAAS